MSFIRAAKYYTKGYSEIQTKVRDATSNADQPPTGRMLNEISQLSFDPECLKAILEILDKRLNDKGKNWRHVYKSLLVLDYLLHSGSEAIVMYFQTNAYLIKTLTDFQYVDEESNKDHGASVRSRAKDIANLLSDEARLRQTRRNRAEMRDRMMGKKPRTEKEEEEYENENVQRRSQVISMAGSERSPTSPKFSNPMSTGNSDDSRLSAIAAIKAVRATEDRHLMNAFKFSHAADEKKVEEQKKEDNVRSFDDIFASEPEDQSSAKPSQPIAAAPVQPAAAPAAISSNGFPLIVLDDEAVNASQAPQVLVTPTMSTFNPFYQQTQLEMQQAEFQRQQQEWQQVQAAHEAQMQAQQQEIQQAQAQMQAQQQQMMAQQMAQQAFFQQQQQQQTPPASAQVNNPWMQGQQQPLVVSPWGLESTQQPPASAGLGSKNPFLSASSSAASVPSLYTSFSSSSSSLASPPFPPTPSTPSFPPPSPTSAAAKESKFKVDTDQFESIFASRTDSGMDTFGNVGNLRMGPNQHQHLLL